jgi:hypothetical protein
VEGYAFGQLWRALETAVADPDPAVRSRAATKVARWRALLDGMATGEITVGSRTPVQDTPAWVTLDVAHGGFATGRYLAETPLDEDERTRLTPGLPGSTDRERLNLWYLGDDGQAELLATLRSGRYRLDLPEHGALATIAVLVEHGHADAALDLLAQLRPLLHRLRLTPILLERPAPVGGTVHLRSAGEVAATLHAVRVPAPVAAMRATLGVWQPLADELAALWEETVEGSPPRLGPDGVTGGWRPGCCRRTGPRGGGTGCGGRPRPVRRPASMPTRAATRPGCGRRWKPVRTGSAR